MERKLPKKLKSVRGIQEAVEQYLRECDQGQKFPTVTGLALALGFPSREEMERFAAGESNRTGQMLQWARSLIEEETLQAVYRKDTSSGAKFILQCSFGYGEKGNRDLGPITVRVEGEEE